MNNEAVDVAVTAKGLGSTLTGSGLAIYGGLITANEWALVIGVIVGIGGLCVQIWDKYHAHTERKERMRAQTNRMGRMYLKNLLISLDQFANALL